MNFAPDVAVTLWSTLSSFVQVTFWPTLTVVVRGANAMFFILIAPGFVAAELPPQPAAISASAPAAARAASGRANYLTVNGTAALAPALLWSLFASATFSVCLPFGRPL